MLPQAEQFDAQGAMLKPSGFHLIQLPYADDLRSLDAGQDFGAATPSAEQVLAARQMVQTFELAEYDPQLFSNPGLQKHYTMLEAYALEQKVHDISIVDDIFPNEEALAASKRVFDEWQATLPEGYDVAVSGEKCQSPASTHSPLTQKKAGTKRAAPAAVEQFEGDWNDLLASDGNMRKVTIPQIKAKLRELGQGMGGKTKKGDLWELLREAMAGAARRVKVKREEEY